MYKLSRRTSLYSGGCNGPNTTGAQGKLGQLAAHTPDARGSSSLFKLPQENLLIFCALEKAVDPILGL